MENLVSDLPVAKQAALRKRFFEIVQEAAQAGADIEPVLFVETHWRDARVESFDWMEEMPRMEEIRRRARPVLKNDLFDRLRNRFLYGRSHDGLNPSVVILMAFPPGVALMESICVIPHRAIAR